MIARHQTQKSDFSPKGVSDVSSIHPGWSNFNAYRIFWECVAMFPENRPETWSYSHDNRLNYTQRLEYPIQMVLRWNLSSVMSVFVALELLYLIPCSIWWQLQQWIWCEMVLLSFQKCMRKRLRFSMFRRIRLLDRLFRKSIQGVS